MIVFQAEHNILMHPFHMLGVAGVFGVLLHLERPLTSFLAQIQTMPSPLSLFRVLSNFSNP
jgi:hypothetical protein